MILSDVAVKRPVFASVISLLLIAFGLVSFDRLPLREYPDIDPPVVTVDTTYRGAAAAVVETRITQVIEERIAGLEGVRFISSTSQDGRSRVTIEFDINRDVDAAANDVRDRVSGIADNLPEEADPPEIEKADSSDDVIMWLNLVSDRLNTLELTDYAERFLVDRFSALDGVARVRVGGGLQYAMRVWIDRKALAARNLTIADVEDALRADNVELPAGAVESTQRQYTVRIQRSFREPKDFESLVLTQGEDGYLVRLGDVARVEKGAMEDRVFFRGNGVPMVGIGIIKQSQANTLEVTKAGRDLAAVLNPTLPEGMTIRQSYDSSIFVQGAIDEVYKTLFIAISLVVLVIFLFLGSIRAMLIPALVVPVSIISATIVLWVLGFSINMLTLLALVLAIGLVVDDAIVVLENIHRRIELGESPLVAAFLGARQVGFAVVATTLVLISVFVPIAFLQGDLGRLFSEFALTMAAAVGFSSLVALTLSPMMASKILTPIENEPLLVRIVDRAFNRVRDFYAVTLDASLRKPLIIIAVFVAVAGGAGYLLKSLPSEYAPKEDRGAFYLIVNGPEGASYDYMVDYMDEIESRLMPYVESGEFIRLLVRAPRAFGRNISSFNSGIVIILLNDWDKRRSAWEIMGEVRGKLKDLTGIRAFPVMRQGIGGRRSKPVQFVLGGSTYEELAEWRDKMLARIDEENPGLIGVDHDYKETKPQVQVQIDRDRAGDLGVTITDIGRTLETSLGGRLVTTYVEGGEEYDVILEGERADQNTPQDISNIYVRSQRTGELISLASLVNLDEEATSKTLNRYNRVRAITLEANLKNGLTLGQALDFLDDIAAEELPATAQIDYKGQSRDFKSAGGDIVFVFVLGLIIVFLVLAAQFESYIHPFVIMLTVPLAMAGGLLGLFITDGSLNIYTQIGLIMLVGLSAKNGILIVEFANQLRDDGIEFATAVRDAALTRLRPIIMTGITTAAGATPLILASGAGAETRTVIGTVVFAGVVATTFFTMYVVPVAYSLFARHTGSPLDTAKRLQSELTEKDS